MLRFHAETVPFHGVPGCSSCSTEGWRKTASHNRQHHKMERIGLLFHGDSWLCSASACIPLLRVIFLQSLEQHPRPSRPACPSCNPWSLLPCNICPQASVCLGGNHLVHLPCCSFTSSDNWIHMPCSKDSSNSLHPLTKHAWRFNMILLKPWVHFVLAQAICVFCALFLHNIL